MFYDLSPSHSRPIRSRAFRTFSGHAHFFLWECTKWALLTYMRVTSGGSKSERKRLQSQPASLGLASALNYGRCIIQDTAHTFSSSSRAKVSLNKGVIYEGPDGRNPVYGAFFYFGECMRARLLSGERDLNSKLTVQMPLYLSLHRFAFHYRRASRLTRSQPHS